MMRIAGRGEDGTSKAIKTSNKGEIHVHLTGDNTVKNVSVFSTSKTLINGVPPNNVIDIQHSNTNVPIVIESIIISADSNFGILIEPNDNTYTRKTINTISSGLAGELSSTPTIHTIRDGFLNGWELLKDDENWMVAKMNTPLNMPFGGRIRLMRLTSDVKIAVVANYKELN